MKQKVFILVVLVALVCVVFYCCNTKSADENHLESGNQDVISRETDDKENIEEEKKADEKETTQIEKNKQDATDSIDNQDKASVIEDSNHSSDSNSVDNNNSGDNQQDDNTIELPILPTS